MLSSFWNSNTLFLMYFITLLYFTISYPNTIKRLCFEALDRSLQDIMKSDVPFGGKATFHGRIHTNFVSYSRRNKAVIVDPTINSSHLWRHCKIFTLTQNMRLQSRNSNEDQIKIEFSEWLLKDGKGKIDNLYRQCSTRQTHVWFYSETWGGANVPERHPDIGYLLGA